MRVCIAEMTKRNSAAGNEITLEQENLQLRARIHQLEERYAKLEEKKSMEEDKPPPKKTRKAADSRNPSQTIQVCPSPPKSGGETVSTRFTKRGEPTRAVDDLAPNNICNHGGQMSEELAARRAKVEDLKNHLSSLFRITQCKGIRRSANAHQEQAATKEG